MPKKSSPLDALPCSLLKSCSEAFAPAFARFANQSMQTGKFPLQTSAGATTVEKKTGLDSSSPANYRPISSLATVSKVIERLVLTRLRPHLLCSTNFSDFLQSAYRKGHSTESALLEVLDGVYTVYTPSRTSNNAFSVDNIYNTQLPTSHSADRSIDLFAAFDTVGHEILLERLHDRVRSAGMPLTWLRSYLDGRGLSV